jgi:hypothetical protein
MLLFTALICWLGFFVSKKVVQRLHKNGEPSLRRKFLLPVLLIAYTVVTGVIFFLAVGFGWRMEGSL